MEVVGAGSSVTTFDRAVSTIEGRIRKVQDSALGRRYPGNLFGLIKHFELMRIVVDSLCQPSQAGGNFLMMTQEEGDDLMEQVARKMNFTSLMTIVEPEVPFVGGTSKRHIWQGTNFGFVREFRQDDLNGELIIWSVHCGANIKIRDIAS